MDDVNVEIEVKLQTWWYTHIDNVQCGQRRTGCVWREKRKTDEKKKNL